MAYYFTSDKMKIELNELRGVLRVLSEADGKINDPPIELPWSQSLGPNMDLYFSLTVQYEKMLNGTLKLIISGFSDGWVREFKQDN